MPNIHMALPETEQNIFRPIVISIVEQVQEITKMKETKIYWPEGDKVQHSSGSIDSTDDRYISTTSKRMNYIEVEEEIDTEEMSPTFFQGREYPSIVEDKKLGLFVSPVYAKHNVVISFNYKCGSKTEATRWLQDMRMKLSKLRDINEHTVSYHFNLNETTYDIVKKIYELRESRAPYQQTFEQYLTEHATAGMTAVGDMVGKAVVFGFAQTQTEIYGQFEFDALPSKPEKDEESGMWVIAFGYKFNYDKPVGCHVKYPIIVHNSLMPYKWVSFTDEETRSVGKVVSNGSRTQNALRDFRADRVMDKVKSEDGILLVPAFDDFDPEVQVRYMAGLVQGLAVLEDGNQRDLVSLQDLGDVALDSDVLDFFLRAEYPYLLKPYHSLFHISVYQNNVLQHWDRFEIDPSLLIKAKYDLDIRNQYRFRLSVITDLDFVKEDAVRRVRAYPKVILKVVQAINQAFRENPGMNKLGMTKLVHPCMFDYVYRHLLGKDSSVSFSEISFADSQYLRGCSVTEDLVRHLKLAGNMEARTMVLGILAHRKEDV